MITRSVMARVVDRPQSPPLKILCAKCQKPVDQIDSWMNDWDRCWEITVHCHGETDTRRIAERDLVMDRSLPDKIMGATGVAFDQTPAAIAGGAQRVLPCEATST